MGNDPGLRQKRKAELPVPPEKRSWIWLVENEDDASRREFYPMGVGKTRSAMGFQPGGESQMS